MELSLIIPHYNRIDRLHVMFWRLYNLNITSIHKFEVIVIDGGTDHNQLNDLIHTWKDKLNLILINTKVCKWENPARPRNIGYRVANGKYCIMIDADYIPCDQLVDQTVEVMQAAE